MNRDCIKSTLDQGSDLIEAYRTEWCHHCCIIADALWGDRKYVSGDETIGTARERYPCMGPRINSKPKQVEVNDD